MDTEEIKEIPDTIRDENEEDKIIQLCDVGEIKLTKPVSTGFSFLDDKMLGGLRGGDLMILSGKSGEGKTHLTLQMIKSFSDNKQPVLLFTYEERPERIKWRMSQMGIDINNSFLAFLPKANIKNSVEWVEKKILDGFYNYLIKIAVIDNLDFLTAEAQRSTDDKWSMQSRIIGMLKRIANEHNIAIILNAHIGKTKDKELKMEDLYGSGDVYKLADYVLFIKRDEGEFLFDDDGSGEIKEEFRAKLILEKNRLTGKKGYVKIKSTNGLYKQYTD
jgi:replicative DNA helicase